jgi:hypothetical protein
MARFVTKKLKTFNKSLVSEQLQTLAISGVRGVTFAGFDPDVNVLSVAEKTRAITTRNGKVTESAEPGEIWVDSERELTEEEKINFEVLFESHNDTHKSKQQVAADLERSDLDALETLLPELTLTEKIMARLILRKYSR